jgi:hypothetical protein
MRIAAASMPLTIPDGDALRVYTKALKRQMKYEVMRVLNNAHVFANVRLLRYLYDKCKFNACYKNCMCNAVFVCRMYV